MDVTLELPYPPSANKYWRNNRGRFHISKAGAQFCTHVRAIVLEQRINTTDQPVSVDITAHAPDRRRRDLDNLLKATLDSLERSEVLVNDNQVKGISMRWGEIVPKGKLVVQILAMDQSDARLRSTP